MFKNSSNTKIILAIVSLVITFFVWQQGLKESLNRPSVSFDINQKEIEITELAKESIPKNLENLFLKEPLAEIKNSLSKLTFDDLSDRNKLILLLITESDTEFDETLLNKFSEPIYQNVVKNIKIKKFDNAFIPSSSLLDDFVNDKFMLHLLNKKFDFYEKNIIPKQTSNMMFMKIIFIKTIPVITVLIGTILVIASIIKIIILKKIEWKEYKPLDLNLIDMVLLVSGGFVVLGEVISPLFSITMVELFSNNLSPEISQSLKIFFGYLFMALPPLFIIYRQIKIINNQSFFNEDFFEFNLYPISKSLLSGFKGCLMVIPFVLLISLIMNLFIDNQVGSNPLLEIVLNNNNFLAFILLLITTTIFAPFFEEIIFRGVLLPILSRDFGKILGIILSSFIFALAHLSFSELPPLFILGVGLGTTRLVSGRLSSSIIMHSLWNGLTFLNLFLLRT